MKINANRIILVVSVATVASFALTYSYDYRWAGHVVAGMATLGFLVGTVVCGMRLAGRLGRSPDSGGFRLHRKLGVALTFISLATFSYGLWIMLPQGKHLLETGHGWFGVIVVILCLGQTIPRLASRVRKSVRGLHRGTGYLLAGCVVLQVILGVILLPVFAGSPPPARFSLPWLAPTEESWQPDGVIGASEYFASRVVDGGNYEIFYRTDGRYLYIGMKAKTTGWVAVGIETGAGMQNAGMVFGYVSEGKVVVQDSFGVSPFEHSPDTALGGTDDIVESGGKEEDGSTIIEFKLPIFTADKYDVPLVPGVQRIIWAYAATDRPEKHIAQGRLEINFEAR